MLRAAPQYDFAPVSAVVEAAIAAKKLPGAVVVVGHGGKVVFEKAYGDRAQEPAVEPMTTDTIFDMASLSKCLVTATAVMQLVEAGKVDVDAPVAKYLPRVCGQRQGGGDGAGAADALLGAAAGCGSEGCVGAEEGRIRRRGFGGRWSRR